MMNGEPVYSQNVPPEKFEFTKSDLAQIKELFEQRRSILDKSAVENEKEIKNNARKGWN